MLDSTTVLKGIATTTTVINTLNSLVKGTKGVKRALLLELQSNIQLILLYRDDDAPIDKVINKLEISQCKAALESNFNFNSLKRTRVSKSVAKVSSEYGHYVGWTTEQLFANIYLRTKNLQNLVDVDPTNRKFRKRVRLINILKLMLLLLRHLKS
ncbi:MAG: hypothetical protein ACE5LB_06650 [Acidiferrobacterales bacterium]